MGVGQVSLAKILVPHDNTAAVNHKRPTTITNAQRYHVKAFDAPRATGSSSPTEHDTRFTPRTSPSSDVRRCARLHAQ